MELAVKLGCHSSLISKLERGWQTRVNDKIARKLRRIFGDQWSVDRLLEQHSADGSQ